MSCVYKMLSVKAKFYVRLFVVIIFTSLFSFKAWSSDKASTCRDLLTAKNDVGIKYLHENKYKEAFKIFSEVIDSYTSIGGVPAELSPQVSMELSRTLARRSEARTRLKQHWSKVMSDIESAIAADPQNALAYKFRGDTYRFMAIQKMMKRFSSELAINGGLERNDRIMVFFDTHISNPRADFFDMMRAALSDYDRAIELGIGKTEQQDTYFYRGKMQLSLGKLDEALESFKNYIQYSQSNYLMSYAHAQVGELQVRGGGHIQAIESLTKAADFPNVPMPLTEIIKLWRGKAKLATEDYRGAIDEFQEVVSMNPGYPETYELLARAHRALGNVEQYQAHLNKKQQMEDRPPGMRQKLTGALFWLLGRNDWLFLRLVR